MKVKWFFRPTTVIVAILFVGPLALPLLWLSPEFKNWHKIFISILVVALTLWLAKASIDLYNTLLKEMQKLQEILNLK